jgi:hypothetical protein
MKEIIHSEHICVGGNGIFKWVLEINGMTGRKPDPQSQYRENSLVLMDKVKNIVLHKTR